jgi:hypothetical protein
MKLIVTATSKRPITQKQIARHESWIGTHPRYEKWKGGTSERMVRERILRLRTERGLWIMSSDDGYWIVESIEQGAEFLEGEKHEAEAVFETSLERYEVMKHELTRLRNGDGFQPDLFE